MPFGGRETGAAPDPNGSAVALAIGAVAVAATDGAALVAPATVELVGAVAAFGCCPGAGESQAKPATEHESTTARRAVRRTSIPYFVRGNGVRERGTGVRFDGAARVPER